MPLARAPHHQLANRQLFCLIQVKRPPGLSSTPSNGYCRKSEPIHNVEHQPPLQQGPFRSPFNSTVSTMQSSEGVAKLSLSRTRLSATSASKLYVAPSINNLFNARLSSTKEKVSNQWQRGTTRRPHITLTLTRITKTKRRHQK